MMTEEDIKNHHKMINKLSKQKNKNQIEYQVLTWGPCVVKLKITDEFFKILTEECNAAVKEENLYQHRLAGIIKKEYKEYKGKSSGPGGISFIYGEGNRQAITYQAHFPAEKDLFIFPAWLKHYVAPFKSDVERISVSGNIASNVPFSAIKKKL